MRLTVQTDYALRTLVLLATRPGEVVPSSVVAAAFGISAHHVAKVAKTLVRLGYLRAHRGHAGGLELAMAPDRIHIGEVVRRVEPDLTLLECFDAASNTCPVSGACALEHLMRDAREAFFRTLDTQTLADIVRRSPKLGSRLLRVVD